ncbi:hypothetical protein OESDEN_19530 [Oesophagostomum dentatum]|uniref:Uncharacterized protein n=1 Tax=Oesophagostomum dentatum TaxID=61180 RepID=A0A0B1SA66_OESDE|nr:hypothetical protein OESDEN_19530 [Oesophagostomum dentatum]
MDRLSNAIDTLVDETCDGLLKPKHLRNVAKECGLELTKDEANDIATRMVTLFRSKFRKGIDEFVEDVGIEKKLSDLKILAEECKAKCEETGETVGYRSLGVSFGDV